MKERLALIDRNHAISIRRQTQILSINRSQLYYKPAGEIEENLTLTKQMDKLFLADPTLGVLGMQDELAEIGLHYNVNESEGC